jgi:glycosyltransferase involved in cell wall biosynthesis
VTTLKIALVQTPLTVATGGERQSLELAVELQKMGHTVEVFTNAVDRAACYPELLEQVTVNVAGDSKPATAQGKRVGRVGRVKGLFNYYSTVYPRMKKLANSIPAGFDVINNHNFPTEWAASIAKKRLKIPIVWMCNDPPFWYWHPETRGGRVRSMINWYLFDYYDKKSMKQIDEFVALSNLAGDLIQQVYDRPSKVVHSGVHVELFHNASGKEVREKYGLTNEFVLLQVGTLQPRDPYKRQVDSIKALSLVAKRFNHVRLMLEGSGSTDMLRRVSKDLGVEDKVIFTYAGGSGEEIAKTFAACDAFIFPSEVTWGLSVTEAMAASKPVVVSKRAGASEIIAHGVNGLVVDHAQPEQLAAGVERLVDDCKLCRSLGEHAYEYVKANLSWPKYAENMAAVFTQTVAEFRSGKE